MLLFWIFCLGRTAQKFKNGKVYHRVTIFGNSRDFVFFYTAQLIDPMSLKKKCLISLTGLHSLIWACYSVLM